MQQMVVVQRQGPAPTVSVVVSFLNSARTIRRCLLALLDQDYSGACDIIAVDGGSTDGSTEVCRQLASEHPSLRVLVEPGASESEGQTIGIARSSGEVVMFTNADVYVPRDWVSRHVRWIQEGYDLVGGRVVWGGDKFSFTWNTPVPRSPQFVQRQGMGLGFSNCSVRRDVLIAAGGLKDMVSQHDTEFAFRVVRRGGKMVLDPATEVYHDHPLRSFRGCFLRSYLYTRNHVVVMRASYGRVVMSSERTTISVSSLAWEFLKDWLLVNGVRAYAGNKRWAASDQIKVSLPEFLFIRLFATKLGQMFGAVAGLATSSAGSGLAVKNAHVR